MKLLSRIIFLVIITVLGLSSCGDEPDGKWEKMKWFNVNELKSDQGAYLLYPDGGCVTFECKNYSQPWIAEIIIDGVPQYFDHEDSRFFDGNWFEVKFDGNKLIIIFEPLPESLESRSFDLQVTAGDIFHGFSFRQKRE